MNRIKGVIFDWAGTAVDFGCTSPVSAFKEAFRRAGIDVTDEEVRAPMGLLKRDHIKTMLAMPRIAQAWKDKYGAEATDADAERIYGDFEPALMAVLDRHCDLIPGLLETVAYLRANDIKIGSTTGFTQEMMAVVTEGARKAGYAPDMVQTADINNGFGRPWPYMIFANMRGLGLSSVRQVVKVGDTTSDMAEAKNAGVIAVGVCEGSSMIGLDAAAWQACSEEERAKLRRSARERFYKAGADFVIDRMADLPALIEDLNARSAAK